MAHQIDLVKLFQEISDDEHKTLDHRDCFYLATFIAIAERLETVADGLSDVTNKLDAIRHEMWSKQSN